MSYLVLHASLLGLRPLRHLLVVSLVCLACACDDGPSPAAADAGGDAGPARGDSRSGWVSCGADACKVGKEQAVCCYEADPAGACISPRIACGTDEQGFGCDGPEDCGSDDVCCLLDGDAVGWCVASCTLDRVCHTHGDCEAYERCEPMAHGYGRCTSDDVRTTPGHDGEGVVFCGDATHVCGVGERCCVDDDGARCSSTCASGESTRACDGPEDCSAPDLCAIEGLSTRCIDPAGMSTDGEPFVCHDSEDCSGYGCEPRKRIPELGFCNPETGT